MPDWVVYIIISIAMSLASYALTPRAKTSSANQSPQTVDVPTVDAGRSIPVVFGTVRVKSPNLLWMGGQRTTEIKK
ncbi:hypothetical protein L6P55_23945 [Klebsiella pneumoniae]|jgi:hypothetical protein|uniref:Tail assembly structural protein n=6 Tax=Yonseivirus TaxID=2843478 RepID=A0A286MMW9_9CAUD|nr:hypothetical protein [Klebsiella pneumoniae]YP_009834145.1 tail assembly chaperone [Klebsiella phage KPN N137]YP_009851403.1 tail assembly chaperone [Klebsiella phage Soft]YP_009998427.1 tail assembly chaperone [Klebsiella phage KPN N98]YP_009998507.1 tail assembly chaperone [Klebsiella phage KPN U2874]ASW27499.1 tail assembly structural protein [Klebsiella phage KPN N54]ASW27577.1 hypothetical protein KPNN53_036 [Klebsiella phage YMC15/11/N53_KPN_BP]ASW27265.1 tail assembly structural pr